MSTVKSKKLQVGTDASASNNFTIYQPATPDGTLRIGVGNADSPTEVARFDATGMISGGATPDALSTATGSAPSYSARAWVNFDGTGTVAIRASGNVSSITDNTTGDYTVNFTTAMSDASYGFAMNAQETISASGSDAPSVALSYGTPLTTSSLRFNVVNATGNTFVDCPNISVTVFR